MRSDLFEQKRIKKNNMELWIIVLLLFILSSVFGVEATKDWITLKNWNDGGILEYQGSYSFYEKRGYRNTSYIFELENGDTLFVPVEDVLYNELDFEELKFRYTAHRDILRLGKHTCVSITTTDKNLVIQQEKTSKQEVRSLAILWSVFAIILSSFIIIPCSFNIFISILHYSWKYQKICKKQK